ncbi:hypothetical protein HBO13_29475 [Pseudomonas lactis]|uniref:Uncharacterized protein n=1 Tax=Pseudomonas lactis TaxID=1615674 RepID=A0A7Y1M7Q3_9PSED|nr:MULTISPECIES: hypothetical protein [Pseudomonas]NNA76768.1 hypothetical protein [Pseudomonas lactis]OOW00536.1 hypothetical protein MF4836_01080 [Pseudomonas sp. MF4836]
MSRFKISLILFALLASSSLVHADDKNCEAMAFLAKQIMAGRQAGVPMTKAIELSKSDNKTLEKISRLFVIAAYEEPAYGTKAMQEKSINEFENKMYLPCIKEG